MGGLMTDSSFSIKLDNGTVITVTSPAKQVEAYDAYSDHVTADPTESHDRPSNFKDRIIATYHEKNEIMVEDADRVWHRYKKVLEN
jgi:hypothetical protein